ncbi:FecR family protein [Pseudoflavitalea sp. G-6-1-2]|uniref:FecR family protein n=1 Tax=Pseudoflavitalea sp. G-6-1-2 TaxID=2728841 RepID=UPI0019815498|nr:FecR family protein [Pseudoflavitalea sp. G-6-1-2]
MKQASASEVHELMGWLSEKADDEEVGRLMDQAWIEFESSRKVFTEAQSGAMLEQILQSRPAAPLPVLRSKRKMIIRISAAATVLVLLGAGLYSYFSRQEQAAPSIINNTVSSRPPAKEIQPAQDKAILTLANGEQIVLDDAGNGSLSGDNGMQLIKLDGQLSYKTNSISANGETAWNTITTAKGRQYKLVLADGTIVWLNAASSLRFPVNFSGDERRVTLNGEAFFEVAKDSKHAFSVDLKSQSNAPKGTITALGTAFNINGYDNEPSIKATLLEGSVRIAANATSTMLKPGQQARFNQQNITIEEDVNTAQVLAWKNNLFQFENESIEDIMRQLSRWYDINLTYEGALPTKHYFGSVRRQVNLTEVLHMLELAGGISFRIEANNVYIKAQ